MSAERKKRVLILTVTSGNGHNACAKAMEQQLAAAGAEVKVIDYLKAWSRPYTVWTVDKGYSLSVAYALRTYNYSFRRLKRRPPERRFAPGFAQRVSRFGALSLLREIRSFRPDAIYCTHFYPAIAITDLRLCCEIPAKVYSSGFDFTMCPFWEGCIGVDYVNLPSEDFAEECLRLGFRREQFLFYGIPVHAKFLAESDKASARRALGLKENTFTVMIMFGGGQWSGGYKIFRQVLRAVQGVAAPVQVIMLNGRNEEDRKRIERECARGVYGDTKVVSVGFTDKVDLYMSAADAIVTKLGGTGATECINKLLPIVAATKLLPQQEAENAVYLRQRGAALTYETEEELRARLQRLMTDPVFYESVRDAQRALRKGGVIRLAEHILSCPEAVYAEREPDYKQVKRRLAAAVREAARDGRTVLRKKRKEQKKQNKE